ncbi:MAG: ankyrin repeat domain-containing protein [Elusimicrobiaceae bacterium]|nr:ankyrin repeat domain-containing protein [Elusimicrobiaceae bacterium]
MFKKLSVFLIFLLLVISIICAAVHKPENTSKAKKEKKYSYLYDTSLIQAIKKQDLERVRFLLLANVDPNETNDEGYSPLAIACNYPSEEIVTLLLDRGAFVNGVSRDGVTPLMVVAAVGEGTTVDTLLEYGADPNLQDNQGKTALMHAVEGLNYDAVSSLLDIQTLDLSLADKKGKTAFTYALETNDPDILDLFAQRKIGVDYEDKSAQDLFLTSIENDDMETANTLRDYGVTLNKENKDIQKALIDAVKNNDIEKAEILLEAGADANAKDASGTAVLSYAIRNGNDEMKELLMSYSAQSKETYAIDFSGWGINELKNYIERSSYNLNAAKAELAKKEGKTLKKKSTTTVKKTVKKPVSRPKAKSNSSKKVTKTTRVTKNNDGTTTTTETNTIVITQDGSNMSDNHISGQQGYDQQVSTKQETYTQESYIDQDYGQQVKGTNVSSTTTGNPYEMPKEQDFEPGIPDSNNSMYEQQMKYYASIKTCKKGTFSLGKSSIDGAYYVYGMENGKCHVRENILGSDMHCYLPTDVAAKYSEEGVKMLKDSLEKGVASSRYINQITNDEKYCNTEEEENNPYAF